MQLQTFAIKSIIVSLALATASIAYAEQAAVPAESSKPVVEQLVNTLTTLSGGPHKGYRANHAKGILVNGTFTPAKTAASLSSAPHLQNIASAITVRLSDATGVPNMPDASGNANPHGIAIRFQLPNDATTDIVSISTNGFPAATPEEFLGLLNAIAASGDKVPSPKPIETFLGTHPAAKNFVEMPKPAPVSFGTLAFYGVNAFKFTNAQGVTQYARYRIMPVAGQKSLTDAEVKTATANYLFDELPVRLAKGPVEYQLIAQLAKKDDVLNNGTVVWADNNPQVVLGTLALKSVVADSAKVEKTIMFNPLSLPDGIAASEDPVLLARPGAYAVSFGRRVGH